MINGGRFLSIKKSYILRQAANHWIVITWVSSDPGVATVDSIGNVTGLSEGDVEIYAYTCNGLFDYQEFSVGPYVGYEDEGYSSKCRHLFGKYVDNPCKPYGYDAPKSAYEENYVHVTVKVWDFKKGIGSEKITKNSLSMFTRIWS